MIKSITRLLAAALASTIASAQTQTFTNEAAFLAALTENWALESFESAPVGPVTGSLQTNLLSVSAIGFQLFEVRNSNAGGHYATDGSQYITGGATGATSVTFLLSSPTSFLAFDVTDFGDQGMPGGLTVDVMGQMYPVASGGQTNGTKNFFGLISTASLVSQFVLHATTTGDGFGIDKVYLRDTGCFTSPDDEFEPNDDCSIATIISPPGQVSTYFYNRFVRLGANDWHAVAVPPGFTLAIDAMITTAPPGTDIDAAFFASCSSGSPIVVGGADYTNCAVWTNSSAQQQTINHRVTVSAGSCAYYKMRVRLWSVSCQSCASADVFEPNDSMAMAAPLSPEDAPVGLTLQSGDEDWYSFTVPAGGEANVSVFHSHTCGDLQMDLLDDAGAVVDSSYTTNDFENGTINNPGQVSRTYFARLNLGVSTGTCTDYDLVLTGISPLGTATGGTISYCGGESSNSIGPGAVLTSAGGFGTDLAVFRITGLPDTPGLLFAGPNQVADPFGCGVRCVGGSILRGAVALASTNTVVTTFDMSAPNARRIQYWYRDPFGAPCGSTFNVSNALTQ